MTRRKGKIPALLLLWALLLTFCSCGNGENPPADSPGGDTAENTDTAEPAAVLCENGQTRFLLVRGEDAPQAVTDVCRKLKSAFAEKTGAEITLISDFTAEFQKTDISRAITVGITADPYTEELAAGMKTAAYSVTLHEGRIYLAAGSEEALSAAADAFIGSWRMTDGSVLRFAAEDGIFYEPDTRFASLTVGGTELRDATIVCESGAECAEEAAAVLQKYLTEVYGRELPVRKASPNTDAPVLYVGAFPGSACCAAVLSSYDRPNYYWDIAGDGKDLYLVGQGPMTVNAAVSALTTALDAVSGDSAELTSFAAHGDVRSEAGCERDAAADVRYMTSNVLWSASDVCSTQKRCEILTDTFLCFLPDVIGFNEMFMEPKTKLTASLAPYYDIYYPEFEDVFHGDWTGYTNSLDNLKNHVQATPIAVRKDAGLTVTDSGFRYTSEKWWIHSVTWAVLRTRGGRTFAVINNHYGAQDVGNFAKDTLRCAEDIRQKHGDIPMIVGGDLYSAKDEIAYTTLVNAGYSDPFYVSAVKASPKGYGSYHVVGNRSTGLSVPIDHVLFSTGKAESLRYHIVINAYTKFASDHYPVYTDLRFL